MVQIFSSSVPPTSALVYYSTCLFGGVFTPRIVQNLKRDKTYRLNSLELHSGQGRRRVGPLRTHNQLCNQRWTKGEVAGTHPQAPNCEGALSITVHEIRKKIGFCKNSSHGLRCMWLEGILGPQGWTGTGAM